MLPTFLFANFESIFPHDVVFPLCMYGKLQFQQDLCPTGKIFAFLVSAPITFTTCRFQRDYSLSLICFLACCPRTSALDYSSLKNPDPAHPSCFPSHCVHSLINLIFLHPP